MNDNEIMSVINNFKQKKVVSLYCNIRNILNNYFCDIDIEIIKNKIKIEFRKEQDSGFYQNIDKLVEHVYNERIDLVRDMLLSFDNIHIDYSIDFENQEHYDTYFKMLDKKVLENKKICKEINKMNKLLDERINECQEIKLNINEEKEQLVNKQKQAHEFNIELIKKEKNLELVLKELTDKENDLHIRVEELHKMKENNKKYFEEQKYELELLKDKINKEYEILNHDKQKFELIKKNILDTYSQKENDLNIKQQEIIEEIQRLQQLNLALKEKSFELNKKLFEIEEKTNNKNNHNIDYNYYSIDNDSFASEKINNTENIKNRYTCCCFYESCIIL
jgi:hypothetical protein